MPTKKRISIPGAIAHIMGRGIDGKKIFHDDESREYFLSLLGKVLGKTEYLCYAWVFMDNHYHLVVRCSQHPLEKLMRPLHGQYAKYFNRKTGRRGYVFQDRFKSIISQDQYYLEQLIRYVHLNPLRANIVKDLTGLVSYQWSGHQGLIGKSAFPFQSISPVLKRFGATVPSGRKAYLKFMSEGLDNNESDSLLKLVRASNQGVTKLDKPQCWVIGDQDFVVTVAEKYKQNLDLRKSASFKMSLDDVCEKILRNNQVEKPELFRRSRQSNAMKAKKTFAYVANQILNYPLNQIARYLDCGSSTVSWLVKQGEKEVETDHNCYLVN